MKRRKRIILEEDNSEPKAKPKRKKKIKTGGRKKDPVKATVDPRFEEKVQKQKRGRGRPSKRGMPLDLVKVFINCLAVGLSQQRACKVVGIEEKTFIDWKMSDPTLKTQVDAALPRSIFGLAAKAMALTDSKNDSTRLSALKWLLPKLAPEEFMETSKQILNATVSEYENETPDPAFL